MRIKFVQGIQTLVHVGVEVVGAGVAVTGVVRACTVVGPGAVGL
jgi:hypothetical protein